MHRIARPGGWVDLLWRIFNRLGEGSFTLLAAGLAFYGFLAIFPAIAALVSIYGLMISPSIVEQQTDTAERVLPPIAAKLISNVLHGFLAKDPFELNAALAISFVLTIWSARAGVAGVMSALNYVYEAEEKRSFFNRQLIAVALTLGAILGGIALLVAISVVPAVVALLPLHGYSQTLVLWLRWPILATIVALGFATIYRFAPCRPRARWRVTVGVVAGTVLWVIGSSLFSLYASLSGSYDAIYGSLAAVVVLLIWLWVTALTLLAGAVVDAEIARTTRGAERDIREAAYRAGPPPAALGETS